MWKFVLIYYLAINVLLFLLMGWDKSRAVKEKLRIPESQIYTLSLIGGGLGGFLGMQVFKHKSRKISFRIVFILSIVVHIFLILWLSGVIKISF